MRNTAIVTLIVLALAACGRKGARSSDFDSATAAALATAGGGAVQPTAYPKVPRIYSMTLTHALDRNDAVFGGPADTFRPGDSVLVSIKGQYLASGTEVGGRIRLKNAVVDSAFAKSGAADTAGISVVGLRFATTRKWATGKYQVDVLIDGKFQVAQPFTMVP
jgi:hypothetical protein